MPPNPKGLPIAITQSPILALSESPNLTGTNFSFVSNCKTAISDSEFFKFFGNIKPKTE